MCAVIVSIHWKSIRKLSSEYIRPTFCYSENDVFCGLQFAGARLMGILICFLPFWVYSYIRMVPTFTVAISLGAKECSTCGGLMVLSHLQNTVQHIVCLTSDGTQQHQQQQKTNRTHFGNAGAKCGWVAKVFIKQVTWGVLPKQLSANFRVCSHLSHMYFFRYSAAQLYRQTIYVYTRNILYILLFGVDIALSHFAWWKVHLKFVARWVFAYIVWCGNEKVDGERNVCVILRWRRYIVNSFAPGKSFLLLTRPATIIVFQCCGVFLYLEGIINLEWFFKYFMLVIVIAFA